MNPRYGSRTSCGITRPRARGWTSRQLAAGCQLPGATPARAGNQRGARVEREGKDGPEPELGRRRAGQADHHPAARRRAQVYPRRASAGCRHQPDVQRLRSPQPEKPRESSGISLQGLRAYRQRRRERQPQRAGRGVAAIRARMDASQEDGNHPPEGADAGQKTGAQEQSRANGTPGPPERAPKPTGALEASARPRPKTAKESWAETETQESGPSGQIS